MKQMHLENLMEIALTAKAICDGVIPDPRPVDLLNLPYISNTPYYPFLYLLAQIYNPSLIIELGTASGLSAGHLATGAPQARIITVDLKPVIREHYANMEVWKGDSIIVGKRIPSDIDLLFIDTEHTYKQMIQEYTLYSPLMRTGGIILFDDIWLGQSMMEAWATIPEPKIELPIHAHCGFGAHICMGKR